MRLNKLALKDQVAFNKYLNLTSHELSVYAFLNIYIWKGIFDISWLKIADSLCVFFRDNIGAFAYLAPLAEQPDPEVTGEVFKILDQVNTNREISRIENVEAQDVEFYQGLGLDCSQKSSDYLCSRYGLAGLVGNKYKSKRASYNYFIKNNQFEYLPFTKKDTADCLKLYKLWAEQRCENHHDEVYCWMIEDSLKAIKILLDDYEKLDCLGRVVRVNNQIKAFSFGFKLNTQTFCILYEITDLSVKGLAQFIFRRFAQELGDYKYINIMDDSGLENLKKVKLSYHPVKLVPAYIVKRKINA